MSMHVGGYLNYFDVGKRNLIVGGTIPWGEAPRLYKMEKASNVRIHPCLFPDCRGGMISRFNLLPH